MFQISFHFGVDDVSRIVDHDQTVHLTVYMTMKWLEPRLNISDHAANQTVVNNKKGRSVLWFPDIAMEDFVQFNVKSTIADIEGITIYKSEFMA